jgi:hypothetical protein
MVVPIFPTAFPTATAALPTYETYRPAFRQPNPALRALLLTGLPVNPPFVAQPGSTPNTQPVPLPVLAPLSRAQPAFTWLDPSDLLRKRLLEQTAAQTTQPPTKSRFRTIQGTAIPSTGAPAPDDWMAERPLNPFEADRLPFDPTGLFETTPGSLPSPELNRIAAYRSMGAESPDADKTSVLRSIVMPTLAKLHTRQRDQYIWSLPKPIQMAMDQTYGKPDANHVFTNDKLLRHVLFPLFCSGMLDVDDHMRLLVAEPAALSLHHLIRDYIDIDFTPLRSQFQEEGWSSLDDLDHDRGKMMTACLLHYNGDMATTFRYIGGPLTMEVHDTKKILAELQPILKTETYVQVKRVYTEGALAYMVADRRQPPRCSPIRQSPFSCPRTREDSGGNGQRRWPGLDLLF